MIVFYYLGAVSFFLIGFAVAFAGHYGVSALRNRRDLRKSAIFALEITAILVVFSLVGRFLM